jgi:hypothetical protein
VVDGGEVKGEFSYPILLYLSKKVISPSHLKILATPLLSGTHIPAHNIFIKNKNVLITQKQKGIIYNRILIIYIIFTYQFIR